MPSGGHGGGGGGSHFGGGSFSSSGGSGGSGFGGRGSKRKTAIRNGTSVYLYSFFGRRYYMKSSAASAVFSGSIVLLVAIIFSIIFFVIPFNYDEKIQTITYDNSRYIQMINNAKENDNFLVEGKVLNYYMYDEEHSSKYYITYSFEVTSSLTSSTLVIEGYSYSIYSFLEAYELYSTYSSGGFPIAIETSKYEINEDNYLTVDSVNMDYENFGLMDDYEYSSAVTTKKIVHIARIILLIVIPLIISGIVYKIVRYFKKDIENKEQPSINSADGSTIDVSNGSDNKQIETNKKFTSKKCRYCGSTLIDGESKCRNCGGSRWE